MKTESIQLREDKQKAVLLIAIIEDKIEKLSNLNVNDVQMAKETLLDDLRVLKKGIC